MPRPRKVTPRYLKHKKSGRGRLVWTDAVGGRHDKLLPGAFESPESLKAKARLELELTNSPTRNLAVADAVTVAEVLLAFMEYAKEYYVDPDGKPTKELLVIRYAIRPVRELYPCTPAAEFGPLALKSVRQSMIDAGLSRALINRRIGVVKRIMKWAVAEELIPPSVSEALRAVSGLERGRCQAREAPPVKPVSDEVVDATLPHLPPHVQAMVELIRYTGMRPGEVCTMTLNQIERGKEWIYRPARHKTAYHGKGRSIPLGPNARAVLTDFLAGQVLEPDQPIFSPRRAREERFEEMRANRKSKVQPSQVSRKKPRPERMPTERYTPGAISHAVAVACDKAFPPPPPINRQKGESMARWKERLTEEQRDQLGAWQREHRWHPYQLRHSYATRVRKQHGLEAAQVMLGHSRADVTQIYAEKNESMAVTIAEKVG